MLKTSMKICRENLNVMKIGQKYRTLNFIVAVKARYSSEIVADCYDSRFHHSVTLYVHCPSFLLIITEVIDR